LVAVEKHESSGRWWRESELVWLVALVIVAYFLRIGDVPLRGEEPTRAQIAYEMVSRSDYLVPREQGEPFRIRPPFQNWVIAASCQAFGRWDAWAVRIPSVVATLLTTLLIYGYARGFLPRAGAFAAAAAFATMAEMFKMGLQAETEALFIFLISASLLTWHGGIMRGRPDWLSWSLGYGFMGLAMLAKGIQAPTYFVGAAVGYLAITRQWQRLFSWGHLIGILVGSAILATWAIPYAHVMGWEGIRLVWMGDPAVSVNGGIGNWQAGHTAVHLLSYPAEIFTATLPWSLWLLPFASGRLRRAIAHGRPHVVFMGICLAVAFPTCWIPPASLPRFFAPLFPCIAILCGAAIQQGISGDLHRHLLLAIAVAMITAGTVVAGMALIGPHLECVAPFAEPLPIAFSYLAACSGLGLWLFRIRGSAAAKNLKQVAIPIAVFMVMTFTGVMTDIRVLRSELAAESVAAVKEKIPAGEVLVSIDGHADSLFAYYYRDHITPCDWPTESDDGNYIYFCFVCTGNERPKLPFAWEEIGAISLDRNRHAIPSRVQVVGRRLPSIK
jgi:4-amino-4-deoxy-L-arabinose transferase-like glycosyltransferase